MQNRFRFKINYVLENLLQNSSDLFAFKFEMKNIFENDEMRF